MEKKNTRISYVNKTDRESTLEVRHEQHVSASEGLCPFNEGQLRPLFGHLCRELSACQQQLLRRRVENDERLYQITWQSSNSCQDISLTATTLNLMLATEKEPGESTQSVGHTLRIANVCIKYLKTLQLHTESLCLGGIKCTAYDDNEILHY